MDVSHKGDVDALVANTVSAHGRLDVMVNNAGIIVDGLILDTTEEELDRVHAVNFKGVLFGCQAAGRVMVQQRSGSIINLTSGAIDMADAEAHLLRHRQGRGGAAQPHASRSRSGPSACA